jgi:SPP1 family predicted phage head-tail adaptor
MIPGELRYKITIQSLVVTKDAFGAAVETYSDLVTLRANVKLLSGNKDVENDEIFSPQTRQFITYFRSEITETCRVVYSGKSYRILSISEIGFKDSLQINAELINE